MSRILLNETKVVTTIKVYSDGSMEDNTESYLVDNTNSCKIEDCELNTTVEIKPSWLRSYFLILSHSDDLGIMLHHKLVTGELKDIVIEFDGLVIKSKLYNPSSTIIRMQGLKKLFMDCNIKAGDMLTLHYTNNKITIEKVDNRSKDNFDILNSKLRELETTSLTILDTTRNVKGLPKEYEEFIIDQINELLWSLKGVKRELKENGILKV